MAENERHTVKAFPSGEGAAQRLRRAADEESRFQITFLVSTFFLSINENSQPEGFCMWLSSSTAIAVPRIRLRMAPHGEGKGLVFLVPAPPFCILHFAFPRRGG